MVGRCLESGILCRINHVIRFWACSNACWPSGWLATAWRVESAAESIILRVLRFTLMLADLPVCWLLPGRRICCRINGVACSRTCADVCWPPDWLTHAWLGGGRFHGLQACQLTKQASAHTVLCENLLILLQIPQLAGWVAADSMAWWLAAWLNKHPHTQLYVKT